MAILYTYDSKIIVPLFVCLEIEGTPRTTLVRVYDIDSNITLLFSAPYCQLQIQVKLFGHFITPMGD